MLWTLFLLTWASWPAAEISAPEMLGEGPGKVVYWLTETEHDFGAVRAGKTVRFTFKFQNALAEPIVLQTVRTTCGCTAAEWPEEPIAPNGKGEVLIEFDADKSGAFRKKITVFFDKQRAAEVLWIEGEVE